MIPIQVVFSLPLFALHKLDSLDLHWFSLVSEFGDSNDDDINLDDLFPDIQNQEQASLLHHPASLPQPPPPLPPPFDMVDFMHEAGSYDLKKVLTTDQVVPSIPLHVPSERAGGEARRQNFKSRAANIPRSVSEVFAFATSRTISAEGTAVVLETFGNVICNIVTYCTYCTYFA